MGVSNHGIIKCVPDPRVSKMEGETLMDERHTFRIYFLLDSA